MIVRENISFERGRDPKKSLKAGSYNREYALKILDGILSKIAEGHWNYSGGEDDKSTLLENIMDYEEIIDRMLDLGIDSKQISISGHQIHLKSWQGMSGLHVAGQFLLKEDLYKWVDFMKKYSSEKHKENFVAGDISSMGSYFSIKEMNKLLDERF